MGDVSPKSLERDIMDMLMHSVALQDHGEPTSLMPGQPFASMHFASMHLGGLMVHASHAIMHLGIACRQVAMHQGESL